MQGQGCSGTILRKRHGTQQEIEEIWKGLLPGPPGGGLSDASEHFQIPH